MNNNDSKNKILKYIELAGDREVYISELAEELLIDFDLIEVIMDEIRSATESEEE